MPAGGDPPGTVTRAASNSRGGRRPGRALEALAGPGQPRGARRWLAGPGPHHKPSIALFSPFPPQVDTLTTSAFLLKELARTYGSTSSTTRVCPRTRIGPANSWRATTACSIDSRPPRTITPSSTRWATRVITILCTRSCCAIRRGGSHDFSLAGFVCTTATLGIRFMRNEMSDDIRKIRRRAGWRERVLVPSCGTRISRESTRVKAGIWINHPRRLRRDRDPRLPGVRGRSNSVRRPTPTRCVVPHGIHPRTTSDRQRTEIRKQFGLPLETR